MVEDQIKRCAEVGVKAIHLTKGNIEEVARGNFDFFQVPNPCSKDKEKCREILLSLSPRVVGIVIDEVHVVVKW